MRHLKVDTRAASATDKPQRSPSGSGKIAFIASQVVGRRGRIVGIDVNNEMLPLARKSAPEVARRIGYANVQFRKGPIHRVTTEANGACCTTADGGCC